MSEFIEPLEQLIEQFRRLPGVGRKSAIRMAFGIVDMTAEEAEQFVVTMADAKNRIRSCPVCGNICEGDLCHICADPRRDPSLICVVEDVKAILAMERVKDFNGVYHVLGGTISPIDGRGPDDIAIAPLLERVAQGGVSEVIVATNPTLDGDTTAMYLSKLLKSKGIKTTRLAYGIPVGGELDYADEMTLLRAMDGRKEL
jgi:recombination protein RecR